MTGPQPLGHWTKNLAGAPPDFKTLRVGRWYRVIKAFRDYDGDEHAVGESWMFLGHNFAPHEDGLSLFVAIQADEWHIRLRWSPDAQGAVIDRMEEYVEAMG